MEFADAKRVQPLLKALFVHVLYDEEPLFISDEATLLDVSAATTDELIQRCSEYYRTAVTLDHLREPLWQVLPRLERHRLK